MIWRRFKIYFIRNVLVIASAVLFSLAIFFYVKAEGAREEYFLKRGILINENKFETGDTVTILEAVDGDEVVIRRDEDNQSTLRILGVKSFKRSYQSHKLHRFGQKSFEYLESLKGKKAVITLNDVKPVDSRGRLLGYLDLENANGTIDAGAHMIQQGWSAVYTAYPFSREQEYTRLQKSATDDVKGLWIEPELSKQVQTLQAFWLEERLEREAEK